MSIVYALSTGGCRDGIWLDYTITDLSNIEKLIKLYFEDTNYNNYVYISYNLSSDNKKVTIIYEWLGDREEKVLDLVELTTILN